MSDAKSRPRSGGFATAEQLEALFREVVTAHLVDDCLVLRLTDGAALRFCNPMGGPVWLQYFSTKDANERFPEIGG